MRETYAQRDIVTKLEAFIMFFIRGNLVYSAYAKYLSKLEESKDSGIFANDIDVGSLKLNAPRS